MISPETPYEIARRYIELGAVPIQQDTQAVRDAVVLARALIAATEALETARRDTLLAEADRYAMTPNLICKWGDVAAWLRARADEVK